MKATQLVAAIAVGAISLASAWAQTPLVSTIPTESSSAPAPAHRKLECPPPQLVLLLDDAQVKACTEMRK